MSYRFSAAQQVQAVQQQQQQQQGLAMQQQAGKLIRQLTSHLLLNFHPSVDDSFAVVNLRLLNIQLQDEC